MIGVEFFYSLNDRHKSHTINGVRQDGSDDILLKMLNSVFSGKVDFGYNKKISLFSTRIIEKLNVKVFNKVAVVSLTFG